MRHIGAAAILFLLTLASPVLGQTQITSGVIQGTVMDGTGAALPGASVEIKHLDTNTIERRTTDSAGRFVALQLAPGRYTVTFQLKGVSTLVQDGVVLTVGQSINRLPRLGVSAVAEAVTVTGTPTIETTRSGVAT